MTNTTTVCAHTRQNRPVKKHKRHSFDVKKYYNVSNRNELSVPENAIKDKPNFKHFLIDTDDLPEGVRVEHYMEQVFGEVERMEFSFDYEGNDCPCWVHGWYINDEPCILDQYQTDDEFYQGFHCYRYGFEMEISQFKSQPEEARKELLKWHDKIYFPDFGEVGTVHFQCSDFKRVIAWENKFKLGEELFCIPIHDKDNDYFQYARYGGVPLNAKRVLGEG